MSLRDDASLASSVVCGRSSGASQHGETLGLVVFYLASALANYWLNAATLDTTGETKSSPPQTVMTEVGEPAIPFASAIEGLTSLQLVVSSRPWRAK